MPPAKSNFEFNRDLCLMVCTDLLPFNMVSRTGFSKFFAKNFPYVKLPSQSTLSTTALYDLYRTLKMEVKNLLSDVADSKGCSSLMFDGWTDRYHGRPFLGIRLAFIHPIYWETHVKTLIVYHRITPHTVSNALKVRRFQNLRRAAIRRRKSFAPPPAGFMTARRRASRNCFTPAGKVTAARLRGLPASLL